MKKYSLKSKSSIWNSTWMYVLVLVLIIISAVLFYSITPVEYFTEPTNVYPANTPVPTFEYFYMKECPHCQDFSPIWDEAVVAVGKAGLNVKMIKYDIADGGVGEERASKFSIRGAPTVLYVIVDEKKEEYSGPRTSDGIVAYLTSKK